MAYRQLTMDEVRYNGRQIVDKLGQLNQPVYNILTFLKESVTAMTYFKRYKNNKVKCGAKKKRFTTNPLQYIKERVADGWKPDVIKKRVGNKRNLDDRKKAYPAFENEFGHLEGDTIIEKDHKSAVITLAERVSKLIIALETPGRKAKDIEQVLNWWFKNLPRNIFKPITFNCGKEFSNLI